MKRHIVTLILLCFSSTLGAWADADGVKGNVQLKFKINRNGRTVAHPEVEVSLNQTATVIQEEVSNPARYKIEVTPTIDASSAIRLEFKISEVENGQTTLLSTPSVIVFAGDSASVSQKKKYSDVLELTVTPTLN